MNVTDGDARNARELLKSWVIYNPDVRTPPRAQVALVQVLAAALAEERERARAPFLTLAEYLETTTEDHLIDDPTYVASLIRRAAEETE